MNFAMTSEDKLHRKGKCMRTMTYFPRLSSEYIKLQSVNFELLGCLTEPKLDVTPSWSICS